MSSDSWRSVDEAALRHAWDWFTVHAAQRLQVFNFFSVTTAFIAAAFVSAHTDGSPGLAGAVAAAGAITSVGFNLVEQRTKELVKAGEAAIAPLEERLAAEVGEPTLEIVRVVDRPRHRITKYSFVFNVVQRSAGFAWAAAAAYEWNRYW